MLELKIGVLFANVFKLLPIIKVLVLEYLNLDSLDAAFRGSNTALNPRNPCRP